VRRTLLPRERRFKLGGRGKKGELPLAQLGKKVRGPAEEFAATTGEKAKDGKEKIRGIWGSLRRKKNHPHPRGSAGTTVSLHPDEQQGKTERTDLTEGNRDSSQHKRGIFRRLKKERGFLLQRLRRSFVVHEGGKGG